MYLLSLTCPDRHAQGSQSDIHPWGKITEQSFATDPDLSRTSSQPGRYELSHSHPCVDYRFSPFIVPLTSSRTGKTPPYLRQYLSKFLARIYQVVRANVLQINLPERVFE